MASNNCSLTDADRGLFTVMEFVQIQLRGPFWWRPEDIETENAKGVICYAFLEHNSKEVGYIAVVDVTGDKSEPETAELTQSDVRRIDDLLKVGHAKESETTGLRIVKWMSSHLNETAGMKALVTAYIVH